MKLRKPDEKLPERTAFASMWDQFSRDRRQNRAMAFANLQQNLAKYSDELVPQYFTAKELLTVVAEIEQYTKADQQSASGDPATLVGAWLRGDVDLSRTHLDKVVTASEPEKVQ